MLKAQYAVRGELVQRARGLQTELESGKKLPFETLVWCNIGNPQRVCVRCLLQGALAGVEHFDGPAHTHVHSQRFVQS